MAVRDRQLIVEKVDFFSKSGFWPVGSGLDRHGWLDNFREKELPVALALLDSFIYLSNESTDQILRSQFHRLSGTRPKGASLNARIKDWDSFKSRVIITYPTDEEPRATDSGRAYLRKARGLLGLSVEQYQDPEHALDAIAKDPETPLVFVDDFAGTGNQFIATWRRPYRMGGTSLCFADVQGGLRFYIPILCTHMAEKRIKDGAPGLELRAGHVLGKEYSVFSDDSLVWEDQSQSEGIAVLRDASSRAGIPIGDGRSPQDWCGFAALGLCVALDDTIPDASLPLFYWEEDTWRPLKRRP